MPDAPADEIRSRLAAALREDDYHSCMYQEGIDADALADTVLRTLAPELAATATCDASIAEAGFFGNQTLVPCVLRAGHDGPVHQAANGAKWWPNPDGIISFPEPMTEEQVAAFRTAWNEQRKPPTAGPAETIARLREDLDSTRTELAALHEGEVPYLDEAIVPTPAQWIWNWNRATPANRLATVQDIKTFSDQLSRVEALARNWDEAPPLLPGQALADLRNALSDNSQPVMTHLVQAGEHIIRVHADRMPTPDEADAIGALLDANAAALDGEQPPATVTAAAAKLNMKPSYWVPVCESGRHAAHPGDTCDEADEDVAAWSRWFETWARQVGYWQSRTDPADVPPALRGPNCPRPPDDPEPLRKLAKQALAGELRFATGGILRSVPEVGETGSGCPTVRRDPRADGPAYDGITGYRTWEQIDADPPQFTGLRFDTDTTTED